METTQTLTKRFLNIDELSTYLGTPKSTLYKMIMERRIPFIKFGGKRAVKFDVRAIDAWMERQIVRAAPSHAI
jgi:excisionase family DNA binding protein